MLYNYLKIAFRNITKHSVYSAINIAGLSVGLASSALIFLWVADEMSFNKFHKNYDDLYQVYMNQSFADGIATDRPVPLPLLEAAKAKVSEIQYMAVANWGEGSLLTHGDTKINKNGLAVSEDFLKMFSFPVIKGTDAALADPNSIILTEATAKALFGDEDPLNKTILVDNQREVKVGAIVQDVPVQSSLKFEYLMPFTYFEAHNEWVQNSKELEQSFLSDVRATSRRCITRSGKCIYQRHRKGKQSQGRCVCRIVSVSLVSTEVAQSIRKREAIRRHD